MMLRLSRQSLIRYVTEGISRKFSGGDKTRGRILVVENPELGFDLGPLLSSVLRVPYVDARGGGELPSGRAVVSGNDNKIGHDKLIDLRGSFGEYLLEGLTRGVDARIEALKLSMQQLALKKRTLK
jgi:hypothetical protein